MVSVLVAGVVTVPMNPRLAPRYPKFFRFMKFCSVENWITNGSFYTINVIHRMIQSFEDMIEMMAISLKDFNLQQRKKIWLR